MTEKACRFEDGSGCLTHSTMLITKLPTKDICDIGLAALRRQLDEQARVIGRLREALEEGEIRHRALDKWTLERVEADPESYIWVIRQALSPEPKEATHA